MPKLLKFFLHLRDYISGDLAYENYLKHQKETHSEEKILDKKTFLRDKQKAKWQKVNRCC